MGRQLAALERLVGSRLVDRRGGGVALAWHEDREQTEPGRALIEVARQVCGELG